ncbi:type VI secretion system protein IglI family protein [Piscirickettsia litoralis]|uniref:Uncharacterized protein n=1 Tax=Piscirickettsia litoralis TaxID=1891921 RepID=A0ABX2ZYJ7_9GAMM|nr:type VI secretion system protein IglI family protein [Piscirickettsia litoralis]ODN41642.1 hypothetical protein BGC07_16240 [Piscirickettsia litoralis]
MNNAIKELIYDFKYHQALEMINDEIDGNSLNLELLSYSVVCSYIVKELLSQEINSLSIFIKSDDFDISKNKKNTKSLAWMFNQLIDSIDEKGLILKEPIDEVLLQLENFKKSLPKSIDIDSYVNKFNGYLLKAKRDITADEVVQQQESKEKNPEKSLVFDDKLSPKLARLFKKIELCMELSNQGRIFESSLFYKDIQEKLKNFDPVLYFPEVFIPFYRNLSKHYVKMQNFIDNSQDTLEWHIAEQMYKSSPEALVSGGQIYQEDNFNNTHEMSNFIRENRSILPKLGVIDEEGFSRITLQTDNEKIEKEMPEEEQENRMETDDFSRHAESFAEDAEKDNEENNDYAEDEFEFDFDSDSEFG